MIASSSSRPALAADFWVVLTCLLLTAGLGIAIAFKRSTPEGALTLISFAITLPIALWLQACVRTGDCSVLAWVMATLVVIGTLATVIGSIVWLVRRHQQQRRPREPVPVR